MSTRNGVGRLRDLGRILRREPLVLFMALGLCLFVIYDFVGGSREDPASRSIYVDRQILTGYLQARARNYDSAAAAQIDAMPPRELASLADNYIREEAIYREALSLGLEEKDYLIRQRLVQSLEFTFRNLGESGEVTESDLRKYYMANRSRYLAPAAITFSHIFFDAGLHGWDGAERLARQSLASLDAGNGKADAGKSWPGDRFAYNMNYANRDEDMIASQFGKDMAHRLFATSPDPDHWQGPFRSDSGVHLVRIEKLDAARTSPFNQVRGEVARDYRGWQGQRLERIAADNLVKDYNVSMSADLRALIPGEGRNR